jgi:hypothetical protein
MMMRLFFFATCLLLFACQQSAPVPEPPTTQLPDVRNPPGDTIKTPEVTDGPVVVSYPDGKTKIKGHMRNGKRHGVWSSYFPDGKPWSFCDYENGELTGTSVTYHSNGTTYYTGDYRHGHEVGLWRFYDAQGNLVKSVTYDTAGTVINDQRPSE